MSSVNSYLYFLNRPQYNRPYDHNPFAEYRPTYRPRPVYAGGAYPRPFTYGPRPSYGVQRPIRPVYRPTYAYGGPEPVYVKRRPVAAAVRPVNFKNKQQGSPFSQYSAAQQKFGPGKRPTPVDYQDDEPYAFELPFGHYGVEQLENTSADGPVPDSAEEPKRIVPLNSAPKTRRAAKMAKKTNKKTVEKKKMTDPDPLNILKKINMKRS